MRQDTINLALGIAVALVLLASTVMLWQAEHKAVTVAQGNETPSLELIAIKASQCPKCSDVQQIVDAFKQAPTLTITKDTVLESSDPQAVQLIADYSVKRLPAIILKGDIASLPAEAPRVKDAVVVDQLSPPLYDLENKTVHGLVDLTLITAPLCIKCSNLSGFADQLTAMGVGLDKIVSVAYDSKDGAALVKDYNISRVPTFMMSEDASWYPQITQAWTTVGTVEAGTFVMREATPPYIDLTTGKMRGIVSATYLADKSCANCYDPVMHKQILNGAGMTFQDETKVDVSSDAGKAMVKKYNITLVPTVVVTGDTAAYTQLLGIWGQVGTVEKDGALVFREPSVLSVTYKDLATGKITVANATQPAAAATGQAINVPADNSAAAPEAQAPAAPANGNEPDLNNALAQGLS
jgi:hypothetical protein